MSGLDWRVYDEEMIGVRVRAVIYDSLSRGSSSGEKKRRLLMMDKVGG